jgi:hypothetical protein
MSTKSRLFALCAAGIMLLSCSVNLATGSTPAPAPAATLDATQVALQVQQTMVAMQQQTQAAQQQPENQPAPTQAPLPPEPTATRSLQERMQSANILVYEDTPYLGQWIQEALDGMGLNYTHVGDAIGDFMANLNSGIDWDLIIVGAESKSGVQGEFWDVIGERVRNDNAALIAEVWYLDLTGAGRIQLLTDQCGIEFQRDWPVAESIYWLQPDHSVFNQSNTVLPLLHYSRHWTAQAGDLIQLIPGGDATLLAGTLPRETSVNGVLATCFGGRVIFQTFSNHDYHEEEIVPLWQNYIIYTLSNHFAAQP